MNSLITKENNLIFMPDLVSMPDLIKPESLLIIPGFYKERMEWIRKAFVNSFKNTLESQLDNIVKNQFFHEMPIYETHWRILKKRKIIRKMITYKRRYKFKIRLKRIK